MKKKIFTLFLVLLQISKLYCNDSCNYRVSAIFGSCFYGLQTALIDNIGSTGVLFVDEYTNKFQFSLGVKTKTKVSIKKEINFSLLYAKSFIPYIYQERNQNNLILNEKKGNISLNTIISNCYLNFKVLKFLKLNYGLSSHMKLQNKFDDNYIGQKINWIDNKGKSNMQLINFSLALGFEIKLYKHLSLEYLFHRGLNNYIVLNLEKNKSTNGTLFPQKIRATLITFNYAF